MGEQTKNALQGVINDLLLTVPKGIHVKDDDLEVDYGLVNEGIIITDNYFSVIMDGTIHVTNDTTKDHAKKAYTLMPVHVPSAEEIQVMISEYTLNQVLESIVELDLLEYSNTDQSSDNVDAVIDGFEEVFGEYNNIILSIKANRDIANHIPLIKI